VSIVQKVKLIFFVAVAAAALYLPILSADFVYDDIPQVLTDSYIHNHTNILEVLSLKVMNKDVIDNNRPVMLLSLMVDSLVWGKLPFGYHLTNLLLHSLCSAMVFILICNILGELLPDKKSDAGCLAAAFIAGMVYAVHPVNSEAVCVVTFREDLLATFFTLFVLILATKFPAERKIDNFLFVAVIFIASFAAVGAKENGVAASVYLFLYWLIVRKAEKWRIWIKPIAAAFAATLLFLVLRFTIIPGESAIFSEKAAYLGGSFSQMCAIQPRIWLYQLIEIFWPPLLCADISGYSIRNITMSMALIVLLFIFVVSIFLIRKNRGIGIGIMFYIVAILPVSNFVPIFKPAADRYLYLPMFGAGLALASIVCRLKIQRKIFKILAFAFAGIIFLYLSCFTIERELVWNNGLALWQDTVNKNPYSYTGNNNLGFVLYEKGDFEQAVIFFKKAAELDKKSADPIAGLAITYDAMGMAAMADELTRKAIAMDSIYADYEKMIRTFVWTPQNAQKLRIIIERISPKSTE
jgi:tetratricopeptide (TPR) repeat protein